MFGIICFILLAVHYVRGEYWGTGCQLNSWRDTGCKQNDMMETKRVPCENGQIYSCCHQKNSKHNSSDTVAKLNKIGYLTYYKLGLTVCGQVYSDEDMVAAIAFSYFTSPNPNVDPMCGKQVKIVDPTTLKSIVVTIRDKCETCKTNDIDVSPSAFEKFNSKSVGRFKVAWNFI